MEQFDEAGQSPEFLDCFAFGSQRRQSTRHCEARSAEAIQSPACRMRQFEVRDAEQGSI
jgi:hypothetical protein